MLIYTITLQNYNIKHLYNDAYWCRCSLRSAQTPAWTYPSLTETTCPACGCLPPLHRMVCFLVLSLSTVPCTMGFGGGGGGGGYGRSRKRCQVSYDMCSSLVELSSNQLDSRRPRHCLGILLLSLSLSFDESCSAAALVTYRSTCMLYIRTEELYPLLSVAPSVSK